MNPVAVQESSRGFQKNVGEPEGSEWFVFDLAQEKFALEDRPVKSMEQSLSHLFQVGFFELLRVAITALQNASDQVFRIRAALRKV